MTTDTKQNSFNHRPLGAQLIVTALALGSQQAYAQQAPLCEDQQKACQEQQAIEKIKIHGVQHSIYNYAKSGDPRRVADLVDTPQTLTVLTQDQIQESGKTGLQEILAAQSGVTLGTGENGNAFGDRYIIRGHEARSDVFVDGLRDPGMTTRESFATDRIEITKGPSSTFAGRGSSGGAVNSITKKASTSYNFGRVDASVGSDEHHRLTLDYNLSLSDSAAIRINGLTTEEDKPGREGIERSRDGLQLSAVLHPTDALSFTADLYYIDAHDVPDLGSYFDTVTRKPLQDIAVYAQESDFMDSEVRTFTLRTEYTISSDLRFYNATRMGKTENGYVTTGVRGAQRDATDPIAPGADTMTISTHQGWQEVDYVTSQFNLFWNNQFLGLDHQWVFGLEYTDESVDNGVYNIDFNNPTNCLVNGRRGVSGTYCILDGNGNVLDNVDQLMGRSISRGNTDAEFAIETVSLYVMDTVKFNPQWSLFWGARQDQFDYSNLTNGRDGEQLYEFSDRIYNGHLGLVYAINDDSNLYATYSTATNINGGESDLGANCGYGGICGDPEQAQNADPEVVENIELGAKWTLFDDSLLATAAIFRMTKSDVMESVGDAYSTLGTLNTGKNRVQGFELGLVGDITEQLSVQFTYADMESEVLASIDDSNVGLALSNFADTSVYLQLRYQVNEQFVFGGDIAYQGEMYGGQPDTAATFDTTIGDYRIVVPSYTVANLFANYHYSEALTFRLNIGNVTDKEYWTAAYRSGSFMYLGDGRNVRATVTYEF